MATYKSNAGNILQPGAQINRLSSFNVEGVYAWPGVEAYELIGYVPINNASGAAASYKSFDLIIPSPDRRVDDRVRDNRTSMVVNATSAKPAYIYGASLTVAQDVPAGTTSDPAPGFPADPVTADLKFTNASDYLLFGPNNGGVPYGIPATQGNGLAAATSYLQASSNTVAQGTTSTAGLLPFTTSVTTGGIVAGDFANSMFYKVTADTTFKIFNTTATTSTTVNGGGVYIADADISAGKQAYLIARVNFLRPANAVSWNDIQGFIDFASQVGGNDS
jgi:hypothetical protein